MNDVIVTGIRRNSRDEMPSRGTPMHSAENSPQGVLSAAPYKGQPVRAWGIGEWSILKHSSCATFRKIGYVLVIGDKKKGGEL